MPYTKPGKQALYEDLLKKAEAWPLAYLNDGRGAIELLADAAKHAPPNLSDRDVIACASKALRVARRKAIRRRCEKEWAEG